MISVVKTLNPSNRRRDSGDFLKVSTNQFKECWLAPDGVTIVPAVYDLARSMRWSKGTRAKLFTAESQPFDLSLNAFALLIFLITLVIFFQLFFLE